MPHCESVTRIDRARSGSAKDIGRPTVVFFGFFFAMPSLLYLQNRSSFVFTIPESKTSCQPPVRGVRMPFKFNCDECGELITRKQKAKTGRHFCNSSCKGLWQQKQKPATKDWLIQKYVTEGMDCTQIAAIVGRDSKSVWNWLKGYGIETRKRGVASSATWRKAGTPSSFLGHKHTKETRKRLSEIAIADGRVPFDPAVGPPLKGKRGAEVPTWKGGVTPERQSLYSSIEWKAVVKEVWKRDNAACQRCGARSVKGVRVPLDIHHIVSFACVELRAVLSNLSLLCEPCHYWVHSAANVDRQFIQEVEVNG